MKTLVKLLIFLLLVGCAPTQREEYKAEMKNYIIYTINYNGEIWYVTIDQFRSVHKND